MGYFIKQIEVLERVDQLIRLRATGSPKQLAERLQVSEATVFRIIENMKALNAPIKYDIYSQSYIYTEQIVFKFGFYLIELDGNSTGTLSGGHSYRILKIQVAF